MKGTAHVAQLFTQTNKHKHTPPSAHSRRACRVKAVALNVSHENRFQTQRIGVQGGKKRAEKGTQLRRSHETAVIVELGTDLHRLPSDQAQPAVEHVIAQADAQPDLQLPLLAEARTGRLIDQRHVAREAADQGKLGLIEARLELAPFVLQEEEAEIR